MFIFFSKYTAPHHVFSYCCLIIAFHSLEISFLGLPVFFPMLGVSLVVWYCLYICWNLFCVIPRWFAAHLLVMSPVS